MTLGVEIRVDAPQALPTIAAVEAGLGKVEARGATVGDALAKGFGNGSTAADKTKQSTQSLTEQMAKLANSGNAFAGISSYFQRQADVLEKIRGPVREYMADLGALDELLARGTISTQEYADQVTQMNAAIGEGPEKIDEAKSSTDKLGEAFEALKLPAVGAGVLELGRKMAELAAEAERAQDEYTRLTNRAIKFEDANHSQDQIIADMGDLAESLHTTREKAFELYDTVRDGTDGMHISYADQATMAKEFGLANELAGRGVDQAAEATKRFMFDVASGNTDIRALRQQMIQVPELAELWTGAFHTTRTGLIQMLDSGKVSMRDLAMALTKPSDALDEMNKKATKIASTNEQMMKKWAEDVNIDVQHGMSGFQAINSKLDTTGGYRAVQSRGFAGLGNDDEADAERGRIALRKLNEEAQSLTGVFGALGDARRGAFADAVEQIAELPDKLMQTAQAAEDLASRVGLMTDAWDKSLTVFGRTSKLVMDNAAKIGDAKQQLVALQAAAKAGLGGDSVRKEYEALMTTLNDGRLPATLKVFDSLHEPVRTFKEDLAAAESLYKSGALSLKDYEYELLQLAKASPEMQRFNEILAEQVKTYDAAAAAAKRYADAAKLGVEAPGDALPALSMADFKGNGLDALQKQSAMQEQIYANRQALSDAAAFKAGGDSGQAKQIELEKQYIEVIDASAGPVDKYYDALLKLNNVKTLLTEAQYTKALSNLKEQYGATVSPAEKLARELQETNDLFTAGVLNATDYHKKLQDIGKEQEKIADSGHDFSSGLSRGFHSIRDEVNDTATTIATSMKGAFDEVNADIVTMVTTGTADWGKLATTIEEDFAKIALQRVEGSIFNAATGGATGAATGVATGTSASATMLAAAPGIGAAIGVAAAAAMAAGGAAAGAAQGATAATVIAASSGLWTGGDVAIPRAANGYAGRVGGVGGTDTKLFAAMVTPGETVSVRTPEQVAADQRNAGGGRTVTIVNKHDTRGELAAGLASGDHDTAIVNVLRRNAGAVQSLLKK